MPLYEYRCSTCDHRFEILQRLGQGPEGLSCPECGEERIEKQFSTFASGSGESGARSAAPARGCGPGCGCVH
jgi:putative FmdB family regulatory protein